MASKTTPKRKRIEKEQQTDVILANECYGLRFAQNH
jgi:hypothetical protein